MKRAWAALALVAACSSGGDPRQVTENGSVTAAGPADRQTATIGMDDSRAFLPNTVRAAPGSLALTVENRGHLAHNLVFDDRDLGRTALIEGRASATLTVRLPRTGVFTFVCTPHPGMEGQVVVAR